MNAREALSLAIDRQAIGDNLLGGAEPTVQMIAPNVLGYSPNITIDEYDPDRARELIDEARADGIPIDEIEVDFSTREDSFPGNDQVLEVLQAAWQELGFTINASIQERATFNEHFLTNVSTIEPDRNAIHLHKHTNEWFDFEPSAAAYWRCEGVATAICLPEADELYEQGRVLTGEDREALLQEAHEMWAASRAWLPVVNQLLFHGKAEDLEWEPRDDMMVFLRDMRPAE